MSVRPLRALWVKEWRALSRDRHGLAAIFLMPAVFILVMSLALRDSLRVDGKGPTIAYAVVDLDRSPVSAELAKLLEGQGFEPAKEFITEPEARRALAEGRIPFALCIPSGFASRLNEAEQAEALVTLLQDPAAAAASRLALRQHVIAGLGILKVRVLLRQMAPLLALNAAPEVSLQEMQAALKEEAVAGKGHVALPSAVQQNVPAWLIFGMFFVVIPISAIFITERRQGTLQRLRTMGVGPTTLLMGKLVPFMAVNLVQTALMLGVGLWLVPLCGGEALHLRLGQLPQLIAMALGVSLAAVSWALLVASVFRTTEQATIVGGVGNILMGALGGIMVPRFVMPAGMQPITQLSPMAWGLEGFHAVILKGGTWAGLLPSLARLLVFGLGALVLAAWLARRRST